MNKQVQEARRHVLEAKLMRDRAREIYKSTMSTLNKLDKYMEDMRVKLDILNVENR